jgi:hypothetical protein
MATYQDRIDAGLMSPEQAVRDLQRRGHQFSLVDRIRLRVFLGVKVKRRDLTKEV